METKNARIGAGAKVPHLSYVGDATIGEGSNIGAGTIFANYDGVAKHHTTIGKHSFGGSDTVLIVPVYVAHGTYDHTSILRTIEWRWGLPALTPRDAAARNLAEVLDFDNPPDTSAATITVPPYTPVPPCEVSDAAGPEATEWSDLKSLALSLGWSLPS